MTAGDRESLQLTGAEDASRVEAGKPAAVGGGSFRWP